MLNGYKIILKMVFIGSEIFKAQMMLLDYIH